MNLIDFIPIGKKYRKTRKQLMYESKIFDTECFKREMRQLKNEYIIIFDDGYYLPSSKEEYTEFINKMTKKKEEIIQKIELAYKEMEERNEKI